MLTTPLNVPIGHCCFEATYAERIRKQPENPTALVLPTAVQPGLMAPTLSGGYTSTTILLGGVRPSHTATGDASTRDYTSVPRAVRIEAEVAAVFRSLLPAAIEQSDRSFVELGANSCIVQQLAEALTISLGRSIDGGLLFEVPTYAQLCQHLMAAGKMLSTTHG